MGTVQIAIAQMPSNGLLVADAQQRLPLRGACCLPDSANVDMASMATLAPVLDAFPEWRPLVRKERAEDGSSFEVLEVQAPAEADVTHGLVIDTSGDEITVGFDAYHSHFDEWVGDGTHFGTMAALEFIEQLVSERVAVLSWWKGEQWCGAAQLEAGQAPKLPSWAGAPTIDRIRVRSWEGTLNADIEV